jgi:hypothetical protein
MYTVLYNPLLLSVGRVCEYDLVLLLWLCCFIFIYLFGGTRCWAQGLILARQALYHLSHPIDPFYLCYFGDRVLLFAEAGMAWHPHIYASHIAGVTDVSTLGWDGFLLIICLGWPGTTILSISASQVARTICVSHQAWLIMLLYMTK